MKRDHFERSPRLYRNEIIESSKKNRNLHQKLTRESKSKTD
jgi:hypothetical protein